MQQGSSQVDTSEGFYSKTPISRLANRDILKGKKLNVVTISKKLENNRIESNKVIEINTMKSESSQENFFKDDVSSNSNSQNIKILEGFSGRDNSNCQSALLKKTRTRVNSDIDLNGMDIQLVTSKSKIENILSQKDYNIFKKLEIKAFQVMDAMDEKMIESLQRKEYEIVKSFQTTIKRLMKELSLLNEKHKNENLALLRDNTIVSLEKQVAFFREQSYQLNNQMKDLEQEIKMLLNINSEKDEEINALQKALQNVKFKLMNTSSILENQQQHQDQQQQQYLKLEQQKLQQNPKSPISSENKLSNKTFLITQQQDKNQNQQKFNQNQNNIALKIYSPQSPSSNKMSEVNSQTSVIAEEQQYQSINELYGQDINKKNILDQTLNNQTTQNQSLAMYLPLTPNKIRTQSTAAPHTHTIKKASPNSCQQVIISESQDNSIRESTSKIPKRQQAITTITQTSNAMNIPNQLIGDPSTYLDIEALVSVYIQDKESQFLIKNALMSYVGTKLKAKNQIIQTMQKQLNDQRQNLAYHNQIQSESNELEELFLQAVEDTKLQIQKRNNYQNSKFTSSDRVDLIQKFMISDKFIKLVQTKIFNKKCCDNQNCLFNIGNVEKRTNFLIKSYGENEQVKNYYSQIRELSMDNKINNILDISIDKGSSSISNHQNPSRIDKEGTQSLFQKWKQMNCISYKYKNEGSKSMLNNSMLQSDKDYSSLIFDQNYLKEMQKNQQKIYRMNNQFRRMFKDEKMQDKEIDDRLTTFINDTVHKLEFEDPRRKASSQQNNPNFSNTITSSLSNSQQQQSTPAEKARSSSIRVTYRHGKVYS